MSGGIQFREGFVVGVGAYAVGLLLTISVVLAGLHPKRGLWMQTGGFDVAEYLALYGIIHIPGYGGGLRGELLVNTVLTMFLLVGAGYLHTARESRPVRSSVPTQCRNTRPSREGRDSLAVSRWLLNWRG